MPADGAARRRARPVRPRLPDGGDLVTFPVSARRDGTTLQVTGSIPVAFSAWGINRPAGFGFFGSLASHGAAEFLLVLSQR